MNLERLIFTVVLATCFISQISLVCCGKILGLNSADFAGEPLAVLPPAQQTSITEYRNWVGDILDSLGNKTLRDITLVGTHDSGAFRLDGDLMPGAEPANIEKIISTAESWHIPLDKIISPWALSQDRNAYNQMVAGVRYFDVRCGWNGTGWFVFHLEVGNTVESVLQDIRSFLVDNPTEIVVVEVSHLNGPHSNKDVTEMEQHILNVFGDLLMPPGPGFIPIRKMVELNQRALVTFSAPSSSKKIWPGYSIINSYADSDDLGTMLKYNTAQMKKFSSGNFPVQLYKLSWTLTPAADCILKGLFVSPHSLLQVANTAVPPLDPWLTTLLSSKQRPGNIFIFDHFESFASGSSLMEVVKKMNIQY